MKKKFFGLMMAILVGLPVGNLTAIPRETVYNAGKYSLVGGLLGTLGFTGYMAYLNKAIANAQTSEEKAEILRTKNLLKKLNILAMIIAAGGGAAVLAGPGEKEPQAVADPKNDELIVFPEGSASSDEGTESSSDTEEDEAESVEMTPSPEPSITPLMSRPAPSVPTPSSISTPAPAAVPVGPDVVASVSTTRVSGPSSDSVVTRRAPIVPMAVSLPVPRSSAPSDSLVAGRTSAVSTPPTAPAPRSAAGFESRPSVPTRSVVVSAPTDVPAPAVGPVGPAESTPPVFALAAGMSVPGTPIAAGAGEFASPVPFAESVVEPERQPINLVEYASDLGFLDVTPPTTLFQLVESFSILIPQVSDRGDAGTVLENLNLNFDRDLDIFLRRGVSIDGMNDDGRTALTMAVCERNIHAVQKLLISQASPFIQDRREKTAIDYALLDENMRKCVLESATYSPYCADIRTQLGSFERSTTASGAGRAPADTLASYLNDITSGADYVAAETFSRLIDLVVARPEDTSLEQVYPQFAQDAEILLGRRVDINARDAADKDRTPLMSAARNGYLPIVKFLVEHGADMRLTDKDGKTAEELARSHHDVRSYLGTCGEEFVGAPTVLSSGSAVTHPAPVADASSPKPLTHTNSIEGFLERGISPRSGYTWTYPAVEAQVLQAGDFVAYAGHTANYRRIGGNLGKPDQDAFFVDQSEGVLRVCICDGTGTAGAIELSNGQFGTPEDNFHSGGAAMARFVADYAKTWKGSLNESVFANAQDLIGTTIRPFLAAAETRDQSVIDSFVSNRVGSIIGGSTTVSAVTISPDGECLFSNVGDSGAILVVRDSGNGELIMRYGPSLHKNLNGFQEHDGQWRLGDNINDIDYQKALDVDFSLHGDEEFLIVASDGLWDIFKGPRRDEIGDGMTLADQVKAIDNVATMEISVRGLEDRWRRRASVPPLTLANLNEIIVEAIAGGLNPAQALVERTKKLDSDHDDITVVVVDLRNWASRRARVASDAVSAASDKADNLSNYVEDLGLSVPVLPTNVHDLVDQFNTFVVQVDTLSLDEATKESVFGELSDKFKKDFLIFIRHGASIDSLNDKGRTPLVQAMHDKNVMGVRDLLALGASILVKNSQEEVIAAPEIRACDDDMFGVLTEFGRLSAERDQVRRIRESPVVAAASAGVAARPVTAIGSDRNFDVGFAPSLEDDFQQIVLRDFLPNYRPDVTVVGQFTAVPEILTHAGVENNQALRVETAVGDWYVGHLPGYYGIGTKKPDQDAAFVAGLSAGVFDGSGENPMSAAFPESGVARNYATGGANVAKYLMEKARVTGSLEQAAAAYRGLAGKEDLIYQARATDQLVNIAVSGGGCMMCSVTINEHGTSCRVQNDGDAGMIIITEEGRLIHGPSMHANLEGCLGATKCSLGVDGDGSIGKLEDSRVAIPDNAAYLIVACDGLWDRFYGPRSALPGPASVARDDQRAVDSVNVGRSYAPDEISSLRGSESADGLLTTSSILEALRNAEREGKNPAQALVDLSRAKAMERDVQHDDDTTALVFKFKPRAATSGDVDAEGVTVSATRAAGGPAAASYDFDTDLARFCKVLCMASGGVPDEPSLTLETGSLFSGYDYNDLVLDSDAVAWQHENYVYVKNRGKTYFISPGLRDGKLVLREMAIKSPEGRSYPLRDIMREFIANSAPFKKEFSKMRLEKVVQNLEATRQKCTADMSQCKASFVAYNFDETNEFKELPPFVGVGEMGGVRILIGESMEDAVAVRRVGRTMFCGVFDGHGDWDGLFARHCSRALVPCVASSIEAAVSGGIAEAIRRSIVEFDEAQTSFKDLSYAMRHILYNRGTTMSGFFLDSLGKKLYVTNLGDSRTILINEAGALLYATEDHDPNAAREQVRIKAAGGTIIKSTSGSGEYRLMPGNLSVSRAFGDYPEKQVGPRLNSMGESIDIKAPLVSNEADVAEHPAEGVAYAIVACDGLWDVLSNEEAANIVLRLIRKYKDGAEISDGLMLGKVAEDLILIAKGLGSSDNISAVVVDVQAAVAVAHSEAAAIAASARG